jgi:hypothetical protein
VACACVQANCAATSEVVRSLSILHTHRQKCHTHTHRHPQHLVRGKHEEKQKQSVHT